MKQRWFIASHRTYACKNEFWVYFWRLIRLCMHSRGRSCRLITLTLKLKGFSHHSPIYDCFSSYKQYRLGGSTLDTKISKKRLCTFYVKTILTWMIALRVQEQMASRGSFDWLLFINNVNNRLVELRDWFELSAIFSMQDRPRFSPETFN